MASPLRALFDRFGINAPLITWHRSQMRFVLKLKCDINPTTCQTVFHWILTSEDMQCNKVKLTCHKHVIHQMKVVDDKTSLLDSSKAIQSHGMNAFKKTFATFINNCYTIEMRWILIHSLWFNTYCPQQQCSGECICKHNALCLYLHVVYVLCLHVCRHRWVCSSQPLTAHKRKI